MKYTDLQYLALPLPEIIAKEKWSGNFPAARTIIASMLAEEGIPYPLKCRLELEQNNLDNIAARYTVSQEEALEIMRQRIPDMTAQELEELRLSDKADWMYMEGKVKYIDCFSDTLYKTYPELWARTKEGDQSDYSLLQELVDSVSDGQEIRARIHIRHNMRLSPAAVEEGRRLFVHMPVPKERDGVEHLKIIAVRPEPMSIAPDDAPQPTVYFETAAKAGQVFSLEYQLEHKVIYRDLSKVDPHEVAAAQISEREKASLAEEPPHICFTPYLRALAAELAGRETNPLKIARAFYDYITTKTDYRFVRDYCSIDNLPEYCALNRRGDCGVQALLFITLCRIAGIPAKWQSGLDAKPGDVGEHDWAMFYVPSVGWAHADLSYGGSSYVRGARKRWDFFFGNIDPYRIPINNGFQKEFDPPKRHWRIDPYDNQCGEAEYEDRGITVKELVYQYTDLGIESIEKG